jgi:hypothetical protein
MGCIVGRNAFKRCLVVASVFVGLHLVISIGAVLLAATTSQMSEWGMPLAACLTTLPLADVYDRLADMVVEHLKASGGDWPQNWDELRDDYQICVQRSGQPWSFEELQRRVVVDWQANPIELAALADREIVPPFRVIWLSDGSNSHWEQNEPNQIIADYLKSAG